MREKIDALIGQYEALYSQRMDVGQFCAETRSKIEANIKFAQLAPLLGVLQNAQNAGIAKSKILLPESPNGIVMFVEWLHEDPARGKIKSEFVETNRQIFLLAHMLRTQECASDMFIEGPSYNFSHQQSSQINVPDTSTPVYSDQGQELLVQHPEYVDTLIQPSGSLFGKSFIDCIWHKKFGGMHGMESAESHAKSSKEVSNLGELFVLTQNDLMLIQGLLQHQTGFTRDKPKVCVHGEYKISLPILIQRCERYCSAVELHTDMQSRRDGEIMKRIKETVPEGIPKVFCGKNHSVNLRKLCAEEGFGLIITTPANLSSINDEYFRSLIYPQNVNYRIIKHVIPQLCTINRP